MPCTTLLRLHVHAELSQSLLVLISTVDTGHGAAVSRGSGKQQPDTQERAKALARVMILDSRYFPQELYSDKERKYAS